MSIVTMINNAFEECETPDAPVATDIVWEAGNGNGGSAIFLDADGHLWTIELSITHVGDTREEPGYTMTEVVSFGEIDPENLGDEALATYADLLATRREAEQMHREDMRHEAQDILMEVEAD